MGRLPAAYGSRTLARSGAPPRNQPTTAGGYHEENGVRSQAVTTHHDKPDKPPRLVGELNVDDLPSAC